MAIFRSLSGESLEDFSVRLAQAWRAGQKGLDNGVVLLVFLDDRRMRLEVGYGLEATLTDATAASIIRDVMAPRFRAGQVADGIAAGLDAVDAALAGAYQRPAKPRGRGGPSREVIGFLAVLAVLAGVPLLGTLLSLTRSGKVRRHGWTGGRGGWSSGGIGGGGSGWSVGGGSSSSDGFSGGGGSFGGGGASGSW